MRVSRVGAEVDTILRPRHFPTPNQSLVVGKREKPFPGPPELPGETGKAGVTLIPLNLTPIPPKAVALHLELLYGEEPHHVVEALFKAFAKAVDFACQCDPRLEGQIPSTKGAL